MFDCLHKTYPLSTDRLHCTLTTNGSLSFTFGHKKCVHKNELSVDWLSHISTSESTDHHVITSSNTPGVCVWVYLQRGNQRSGRTVHMHMVLLHWPLPHTSTVQIQVDTHSRHLYLTLPHSHHLPHLFITTREMGVKRWSSAWESLGISCNLCCLNIKYRAGKPPAPATFPLHH